MRSGSRPGALTRGTSRLLALGYAVPGSVLAVGVLLPRGRGGRLARGDSCSANSACAPGLLLTGTIVALIYAYLVRYFAVAWNGIEPAFARITPNMDAAARGLGAGTMGTLLRVHAPLLARTRRRVGAAGVRRRDEGTAGDARPAAVQFRHAGHANLHARAGRAAGRGRAAVARDRRGRRAAAADSGACACARRHGRRTASRRRRTVKPIVALAR